MAHYRFDRHKLFSMDDTSEVLLLLEEVERVAYSEGVSRYEGKYGELTNMLFGLFDGYLYDNILTAAVSITDLSMEACKRIEAIVDKCTNDILTNGQSITAI